MNYKTIDQNKSDMKIGSIQPQSFMFTTPNYVGYYKIGKEYSGLDIGLTEKPKWFHRKMMKICLGIEWFDN
jgi:hypothetical protein